jgi:hypothetical protein
VPRKNPFLTKVAPILLVCDDCGLDVEYAPDSGGTPAGAKPPW